MIESMTAQDIASIIALLDGPGWFLGWFLSWLVGWLVGIAIAILAFK